MRKYKNLNSCNVILFLFYTVNMSGFDDNPFGPPTVDNPFAVCIVLSICWHEYFKTEQFAIAKSNLYVYKEWLLSV